VENGVRESRPARSPRGLDGWGLYLGLAVALLPFVATIAGTGQLIAMDGLNVLALMAFAVGVLTRQIRVRAPFFAAMIVVAVGSLIAVVNAESIPASALALLQDLYLYLWFIMLVSVMTTRGDLVAVRIIWAVVACVIALYGFYDLINGGVGIRSILSPKGERLTATFYDPNYCADYLGMSLFIVLSLSGQLAGVLRWGMAGLLVAAIVATKSNGGALSLFVGLSVWAVTRARTRRVPLPALAGGTLLALSLLVGAAWMVAGVGVGARGFEKFTSHSFLARVEHSKEGRFRIWRQLQQSMMKAPLGIGPGNSSQMFLSVEGRERHNSMRSKEAHSDYLAYAIERGPLAIGALVFLIGLTFLRVSGGWKRRVRAGTADRASGGLAAALAGAFACSVVHSLTIERLHFRHFWMLLAMIYAFAESTRAPAPEAKTDPAPERKRLAEPLVAAHA
jgi:hypothetical protein